MQPTPKAAALLLLLAKLAVACETSDPTQAVLQNQYPRGDASSSVVVYKGWWSVAAFQTPVAPGAQSEPVRVVKGSDFAYALLAPAWDATLGAPRRLLPVRSKGALTAERGDKLLIPIAPSSIEGDCDSGAPLSQDQADFITQRIFPGEFAGLTYDAATCTASPLVDEGTGGAGNVGASAGVGGAN